MSHKHFSVLLIGVVLVMIAIALLVPGRTGRDSLPGSERIFPGLEERINQADRVTVQAGGGRTVATLSRGEQDWTVAELAGYPAKWATVRGLLAGLAQARVIEIKTANPEYYDRLGVEDIAAEDASGLLVTIGMGEEDLALIVGKEADGRGGRYLRPSGSAQSLLSDFVAEVPREASGWVEREVADIPSSAIAEVEIVHPDGDRVHVVKTDADATDFVLQNLPEGRETASSWAVNSLGNMLSALQLDAVDDAAAVDWEGAVQIRLNTFSGMEVRLAALQRGEEYWIQLGASTAESVAGAEPSAEPADELLEAGGTESQQPGSQPGEEGEGVEPAVAEEAGGDNAEADADEFNARVAGWAFRIPSYKYEAMTKHLEDVLKPLDEGTD